MSSSTTTPYHTPALEKGLDILECLALEGVPMTQAQLARALGRGASELFRMLMCLEQRGYLVRDQASGAFSLTLRLYELSRVHTPYDPLLRAAIGPMRQLSEALRESCHLSVLYRERLLVLAQEQSPSPLRLSVEIGSSFVPLQTASGRLLLAYQSDPEAATDQQHPPLDSRLATIRTQGYEVAFGETIAGVNDLAVLIGTASSAVKAALTIASFAYPRETFVDALLPALQQSALAIGRAAGMIRQESGFRSQNSSSSISQ
jgi:DNA-binding IclR family transcriptional regulator